MRRKRMAQQPGEQPTISFSSAAAFRRWLLKHHARHPGIWMKIAKKDSDIRSITYAEALDEALCFGWIDGQKKPFHKDAWLQKFTRRATRSIWSENNVGHVERLTRMGRMQPAGLASVEAAKADGRWERAYYSTRNAVVPDDFLAAIGKHPKAKAFYESLNPFNRFVIYYRLASAKRPETRARRFKEIVAMMKRGQKFR